MRTSIRFSHSLAFVLPVVVLMAAGISGAKAEIVYTKALGGRTGAPFEDTCRSGDYLVGFNSSSGKAFNSLVPVCMGEKDRRWVGGEYTLRQWGIPAGSGAGGRFAEADSARCSRDQFVTALHVYWDKFGAVHHVKMFCHDLTRAKTSTWLTGNPGGEASSNEAAPCPKGSFGIGMFGASANLINRVGLKCQTRAP